jgi:hypothetical protein
VGAHRYGNNNLTVVKDKAIPVQVYIDPEVSRRYGSQDI